MESVKKMTKHPLTDKICRDLTAYTDFYNPTVQRNDMRTAADWQLNRVLDWLDKNLRYYTDDTYLGTCKPLYELTGDIEDAMRPTQEDN